MKEKKDPRSRRRRPRLPISSSSCSWMAGIGLLVLLLGIEAGRPVELVLALITTFAVTTIDILFALSQWDGEAGTAHRTTLEEGSKGHVPHEAKVRASKRKG